MEEWPVIVEKRDTFLPFHVKMSSQKWQIVALNNESKQGDRVQNIRENKQELHSCLNVSDGLE